MKRMKSFTLAKFANKMWFPIILFPTCNSNKSTVDVKNRMSIIHLEVSRMFRHES